MPIAKGSKLPKKLVPENQFAEYPKRTIMPETAVTTKPSTSAMMSPIRSLVFSVTVAGDLVNFRVTFRVDGARGFRLV
jgi:hypothetical protein